MTESAPASAIRDGILSTFPPSRLHDPLVQGMAERLAAAVGADSLGHRLQSWIALIDWARSGSNADSAWLERQGVMVGGPYARWRLLFDYLGGAPEVRTGLQTSGGRDHRGDRRREPVRRCRASGRARLPR
jgi:hypothetical protein